MLADVCMTVSEYGDAVRDVSALANLYIGFNEDRNSMPPMNQQAVVTTIAEGDGN